RLEGRYLLSLPAEVFTPPVTGRGVLRTRGWSTRGEGPATTAAACRTATSARGSARSGLDPVVSEGARVGEERPSSARTGWHVRLPSRRAAAPFLAVLGCA